MKKLLFSLLVASPLTIIAQTTLSSSSCYWQQRVKYTMDIDVNAAANQFKGKQKLEYWNNSPDTLSKVFYHLYWNAFQPGSMMDERSRRQGGMQKPGGAPDWDNRVKDRIQSLKENEIGYQKIRSLKMNGRPQQYKVLETILEVKLDKPVLPKSKVTFEIEFDAQVPVQIRRSGRDNAEGVRFSMSQWYPKLCEYDKDGWHPTPYIAREFYGVWGDFDVKIAIDKNYMLAGTGYLQNPNTIGYGYETPGATITRPAGDKLRWHFIAPNVHDFVWAADPEYIHKTKTVRDGLVLHAFYKINPALVKAQYEALADNKKAQYGNNPDNYVTTYKRQWEEVVDIAALALPFIDKTFGKYPYNQYSFIQGGDGGMEYPMATLLKGPGVETVIHEWMHSWYQMMMGTNESLYAWMDEGFTTYAESRILSYLTQDTAFAYASNYQGYYQLAKSNKEEPLTTHADHFNLNYAYSNAAYNKGAVFMEQLGYIVGADVRDKILLEYYRQWRFKHPDVNDFMRVAEKASGLKLDWYKEYWVNSTKTIDYAIDSLWEEGGKTKLRISRIGLMPMPVDVQLTFKDGTKELHYIPLSLMYGEKPVEDPSLTRKVYEPWKWTHAIYIIETNRKLFDIVTAEIDPTQRMADIERKNNRLDLKW
ncbi:MAG TPA: M1 family metallopeptidase [Chitinophagaceae bacterium]